MLEEKLQLALMEANWGKGLERMKDRCAQLTAYFDYCEHHCAFRNEKEYLDFFEVLEFVRNRPATSQVQLVLEHQKKTNPNSSSLSRDTRALEDEFALAVRVLLCLNCWRETPTYATSVEGSCQYWQQNQSLEDLVKSAYPKEPNPENAESALRRDKMSARYLNDHAAVEISLTKNLKDHLWLEIQRDYKTLHVFELVTYLDTSLAVTQAKQLSGDDLIGSLKHGCYTSSMLKETLSTYAFLFPTNEDRAYWKKKLDKCRDQMMFRPREPISSITSPQQLIKAYPYWGARLMILNDEALSPRAMGWLEGHFERRKDPRFAYKLALYAFLAALFFSVVATGLGAVQVWISYCAWRTDARSCAA